jgi:hypothetical protein
MGSISGAAGSAMNSASSMFAPPEVNELELQPVNDADQRLELNGFAQSIVDVLTAKTKESYQDLIDKMTNAVAMHIEKGEVQVMKSITGVIQGVSDEMKSNLAGVPFKLYLYNMISENFNFLGEAINLVYKKNAELTDKDGKQIPLALNYTTTPAFLSDVIAQYKLNIKNEIDGEPTDNDTKKQAGGRKSRKRSGNKQKRKKTTKRNKRLSYRKTKGGHKRRTKRKHYK